MKAFRMVLFTLIIAALSMAVQAQTRMIANGASSTPAPPPPLANLVAVVDSGEFTDDKAGIKRVIAALSTLNAKYVGVNNELKGMQERLNTMRSDIQKKQMVQEASLTAQQSEQADQLEVQIKRKAEDARTAYQKDMATSMSPLQTDIQTALAAYAKAKGILLIIDANRVPLIYADISIDVTKDFIAEYNRTHPAGTAPAAPARP